MLADQRGINVYLPLLIQCWQINVESTFICLCWFNVGRSTLNQRLFASVDSTLADQRWINVYLPLLIQCWQINVDSMMICLRWINTGRSTLIQRWIVVDNVTTKIQPRINVESTLCAHWAVQFGTSIAVFHGRSATAESAVISRPAYSV